MESATSGFGNSVQYNQDVVGDERKLLASDLCCPGTFSRLQSGAKGV
jgi:hypothetical protein